MEQKKSASEATVQAVINETKEWAEKSEDFYNKQLVLDQAEGKHSLAKQGEKGVEVSEQTEDPEQTEDNARGTTEEDNDIATDEEDIRGTVVAKKWKRNGNHAGGTFIGVEIPNYPSRLLVLFEEELFQECLRRPLPPSLLLCFLRFLRFLRFPFLLNFV